MEGREVLGPENLKLGHQMMQFGYTLGRKLGYLWVRNMALICSALYIFSTVTEHNRSTFVVSHHCKTTSASFSG